MTNYCDIKNNYILNPSAGNRFPKILERREKVRKWRNLVIGGSFMA